MRIATFALAVLLAVNAGAATVDWSRVLWVGAHPDDEALVAPILGQRCGRGSDCSMLVMTEGENGLCDRVPSCAALPSVRAAEMRAAAARLRSSLTQWTLPDAFAGVAAEWDTRSGGHDALVANVAGVIRAFAPTVILTFDPVHGSSCHPAHRATGQLVTEAAAPLGVPVFYVETAYATNDEGFVFFAAIEPNADEIDLSAAATWKWLLFDIKTHHSQFSANDVRALTRVPFEQKRIRLLPAGTSVTYVVGCP